MTISKEHFVGHIIGPGGKPQNVEFIAKKRPDLTSAERAAGIEWVDNKYPPSNVLRYGTNTTPGTTDMTTAIESAISVAEQALDGASGSIVTLPTGTYAISSTITLPNRVTLKGANGRGTLIKPHSSFSDSYMFNAVNGTSSMFGSRLEDMHIDARGYNMTAVIFAQAWQETCGLNDVVIQYDGTTPTGLLIDDGFGGAAYLRLQDIEIFSDSTAVNDIAIDCQQISGVGGFVLDIRGATITGSATNVLSKCVRMANDSLVIKGFHTEYSVIGVSMEGSSGFLHADTLTGSTNSTTSLIDLGSSFGGSVKAHNIIPNGATGPTINNQVSNRDILASDGPIMDYEYPRSRFSAYVASDISNVTGNGTTYTVVFGTEEFDEDSEYATGTGIFTAKRAGLYLLGSYLKMDVPVGSSVMSLQLVTSNKTFVLWRGDPEAIRDSSSDITFGGSMIADLDDGDTARIAVVISGIGSDLADVLQDDSIFFGHYMGR